MEPLHPELREALKMAHPGLTDEVIDEYEELTGKLYALEREGKTDLLRDVDRRREALLKARMPQFSQVSQVTAARRKSLEASPASRYTVEILRGDKATGR